MVSNTYQHQLSLCNCGVPVRSHVSWFKAFSEIVGAAVVFLHVMYCPAATLLYWGRDEILPEL